MELIPTNKTVLCKRVNKSSSSVEKNGIISVEENVDLYEIVAIALDDFEIFKFKVGDIVTSCATGTSLKTDTGEEFVLMNKNYITAKLV